MTLTDQARALGGGGGGQLWGQRLTAQRPTRPEIGGLGDAPGGVGLGDAQPVGQRAAQRAAQFFLAGLGVELVDQRVPDRR